MTAVKISVARSTVAGVEPYKDATIACTPTSLHTDSTKRYIVAEGFQTQLDESGTATIALEPTDSTWCWRIDILSDRSCGFTRYVNVPNSTQSLDFADLTDVDPATLQPLVQSGPALNVAIAATLAEAKTLSAQLANTVVMWPESDELGA